MIQRDQIHTFLLEYENLFFSPLEISKSLVIPVGSVRRELGNLLLDKYIGKNNAPGKIGHLDYFSNRKIMLDIIKKSKRKIQCIKADRKYRYKLKTKLKR